MEHRELKKLVQLMNDNELVELEIEQEGMRVILKKANPQVQAPPTVAPVFAPPLAASPFPVEAPAPAEPSSEPEVGTEVILSPMVGTFYRRSSPEADPYVDVGDVVDPDTIVCIVEAMKVNNELKAECSGSILEILVEDGQPVEYDQPLFRVKVAEGGQLVFERVLIANRGEIALRVIRACRELEIESVVVYSKADEGAAYLDLANEAICIGPGPPHLSYLSVPSIISAAEIANVDAVHPGYGFLAENAHFAEVCRANNIEFIGPDVDTIRRVGDKAAARKAAVAVGIPIVEGSDGPVTVDEEALETAHRVGYPVLIKAVSGGGGRGMRIAHNDISLQHNLAAARSEADAAFGDPAVYIEKYLAEPRHVEIQILGDRSGTLIHLGDRDCSIQRRHQKVVEESPSPGITPDLRRKMGRAAVKLAKSVRYHGAGTVEFLVQDKKFYFIEVNARVQVEHPVSEMVTGVDIVKEQIRVASGENLCRKDDPPLKGCAIECRINAEDPDRNFTPSPGLISRYRAAGGPGVRVDSHVEAGYRIPPNYDSLISKLLVYGDTREEAILRMQRALDEYVVEGVATTLPLLTRVLRNAYFVRGDYSTRFLDDLLNA